MDLTFSALAGLGFFGLAVCLAAWRLDRLLIEHVQHKRPRL